MNKHKRAKLQFQAAQARRLAKQVKPLYAQPELYAKAERKELNARYLDYITPAAGAQRVLGLSPTKQARVFRAVCAANQREWLFPVNCLYGNAYGEKTVMLACVHERWHCDNQTRLNSATRLVTSFFYPTPEKAASPQRVGGITLNEVRDMAHKVHCEGMSVGAPNTSATNCL